MNRPGSIRVFARDAVVKWMFLLVALPGILAATKFPMGGTAPRITQQPSDLVVPKNEPATLQCQADGNPLPLISWYKDQGELISSSATSHTALQSLFGGKSNSDSSNDQPPRITQQNGSLHFHRVVHNKKDKPDAGVYWCVASNQYGQVRSRNATLQISFLRDEFRRQPNASVRVTSESSALLECHPPRGYPVPKIYWKRDGKELKLSGRFTMMDEGNLVISDVRPSDAGQYVCVAENLAATKESHSVSLYVYARPSVITPPQDITALAEDNVVFECKVVGDPLPTVTWHKKDNRRSFADSRFQIQEDGGLRINRVTAADEGSYVCQADNSMGMVSETAVLTVHSRPRILLLPRDQKVLVGGSANFDCLTTGNPSPAVFWTKEGSQILMFPGQPHGRLSVQSDGTLTITGVQTEDAGNYVCSALSVAGSAVARVLLAVTTAASSPPPIIVVGPSNQTLAINAIAILPCQSIGTPAPTTYWLKDDVVVSLDKFARATLLPAGALQISDLRISDSGVYTCVATSESGRTSWSAGLVVESPTNPHVMFYRMPDVAALPGTPSKPELANVTETAIEIMWRPSAATEEFASVRLYRVEYFCFEEPKGWVIGSHPTTLTRFIVTNLRPDSSYVFLVRAMTAHGIMSQPSPLSDTVVTLSVGGLEPLDFDIYETRLKFDRDMVELSSVKAISPTAVSLQWKIVQDEKYIAGYDVKFQETSATDALFSVVRIRKGSNRSYAIFGLKKYTEYEVRLAPFYKEIIGKDSNALLIRTLSDVPDEAPQDVKVTLIDQTTLAVTWHPPSVAHLNGQLAGYRIFIIPTGLGTSPGSNNASAMLTQIRNVSIQPSHGDIGKEIVGNLTVGMRYRITVAARTDAGIGVSSRPLYIKMERNAAGVTELLQQPWFIGVLAGIVSLLLLAVLTILFLQWRKRKRLLKKAVDYYPQPSTCTTEKVLHYHPQIRSSESGSLLPNSIVGLPFVPATSGLVLAHHPPEADSGNWSHCSREWTKQACETNNSRFHVCGGGGQPPSAESCPVHGKYYYGSIARNGGNGKPYGEVSERLAKLETGESSLSSHGRSQNETASVHSRRSSGSDERDPSKQRRNGGGHSVLNWTDLLPPPPVGPPSPPSSERQRNSPLRPLTDSLIDGFSSQEHELAERMADLRRRYQMELADLEDTVGLRRPPPRYSGTSQPIDGRGRRLLYQQHASLDRPLRGLPRILDSQNNYSRQFFAHRLAHNLARTRSCESSINNDDERDSDGSSDNETTDIQFVDEGNNGETSPCLSSEASFFLETTNSVVNQNLPLNNTNSSRAGDLANLLASRDPRQPSHHLHRILPADKFRKPLPLHRNSPRRYFMDRQIQDSPDTPHTDNSKYFGITTMPLKNSSSRSRISTPIRQVSHKRKRPTTDKYGKPSNNSEPPQSVC